MASMTDIPRKIRGGAFLIEESTPQEIFTHRRPERRTSSGRSDGRRVLGQGSRTESASHSRGEARARHERSEEIGGLGPHGDGYP